MLFELINISTNFQNYINKVLHLFLNVFVFVYLNNNLIYIKSKQKYINKNNLIKNHIKQILKKLKQFELYLQIQQMLFLFSKNNFLNLKFFFTDVFMQKN